MIIHNARIYADAIDCESSLDLPLVGDHNNPLLPLGNNNPPDPPPDQLLPPAELPLPASLTGVLSIDTTNAFNSIRRRPIFDQLRISFPQLVPLFIWLCLL